LPTPSRARAIEKSAHTSDEKAARKLLKQRLKQVERPEFVGSKEDMWTLADMRARIEASYARKQNRSLKTVQYCFKHREAAFQFRGLSTSQRRQSRNTQPSVCRAVPRGHPLTVSSPTCAMGLSLCLKPA
jgi:hypothetical protein